MIWQTSRFQIDLSRARVMGIVNVTPDSFSDGGAHASANDAIAQCEQLVSEGADILDIGGESTRPGAEPVSAEVELSRVLPVLREAIKLQVPVSIDTYKPQVMQAALDLGADIVNDIRALRWTPSEGQSDGLKVIAAHPNCGVCLMHMHRDPQTMQVAPMEGDVVTQVMNFLKGRTQALRDLGVQASRIVLDPGIGFGKTVAQNFNLLARQSELLAAGYPLLAGWSRKSSLRKVTPGDSLIPSIAAALLAVERGAKIVRVHDVQETVRALQILHAIK
jgi:dihydropteroate synthase